MDEHARTLTAQQFQEAGGVEDWRVLGAGASAWFDAPSHSAGAALARRLAELATAKTDGTGTSLVDLDVRAHGIRVRLPLTPTDGGFTDAHVVTARAVAAAAAELGLRPDPSVVQDVQLAFDVLDQSAVLPFWESVLGLEAVGDEDLLDPLRRHPPIWFQDQDAPRPLRNRLHLDAVTTQPTAVAAVEKARAAGLRVDEHGYYATVADAEGNEVDLLPLPDGADRWGGAETEDWRLVFSAITCYPTTSAERAAELAEAVAALADDAGLPLGIDVRPGLVVVDTGKDVWEQDEGYAVLAARVQEAARSLGLTADVTLPRFVQVGIDAVDIPAVRGFWRAVLGYVEDPRPHLSDIVDPRQLAMPFFFQDLDASDQARREQRNRIHVDLFVPDDHAVERVHAALAAGGRVVRDSGAPAWWTLADPEGNEVDIAVSVGREEAWAAAAS